MVVDAHKVAAMASPAFGLQCPSPRGLSLRHSHQVAALDGKFGGRASVMLAWRRRRCQWGSPRTGAVHVTAMGGRKKDAGKRGENDTPEKLKFEANDLMELEFGRLLGEPRQATLAKVMGRKVNPDASYIDIEKKPRKELKSSSSSSKLSEAEFARLLSEEGGPRRPLEGVTKPRKAASPDNASLPGLVKPPSRPGQSQAPPSFSANSASKASMAARGKKVVPPVTFGPGGFASQANNKPRAEEEEYMSLVQKPAIPSPDSYKPSWPRNDSVPPMLIGKAIKKADEGEDDYMGLVQRPAIPPPNDSVTLTGKAKRSVEPIDSSLLRKPMPGDTAGPSDRDMGSRVTGEDQEMRSETSTLSTMATVDELSKPKLTPKLGVKPVLAAKPPPQFVDDTSEASVSASASTSFEAAEAGPPPNSDDTEPGFEVRGGGNLDDATSDTTASLLDPEQSIMSLVKKASRIAPVRPPRRFPQQGVPEVTSKAKVGDPPGGDRLAGWSEEVKAAVKRSEAALPSLGTRAPSESEFDQLLQRRKAELRQRPVAPPAPETAPDPAEVSTRQLAASRPVVPSPKPPRDATANALSPAGVLLSDNKRVPSKEEEDQDWARAEAVRESRTVEEVVFTRAISNGMLANFGSIVGFLAAYELSTRRRPPSFSAWAQEKGFKINRKLKSSVAAENEEPSALDSEVSKGTERAGGAGGADEEYKQLLDLYGKFRADLLSALVGETAKVLVVAVERERKQLRFSEKEAEGEGQEIAQKRAHLLTSLNVGDVVKCTVKKVTNFGAFVELEGVPALIHISELAWNRVMDPSTILNVGQDVEVKVCRLDRYLQRISLSLKQMQPDPLRETLESLDLRGTAIDDDDDDETSVMPELLGLTKRLEAHKGINSVQRGRRLQGNALAPTFQVYLADQLEDGFKLLARSGNLVQEVLVQTALDRESMKDAIRQCTFSEN